MISVLLAPQQTDTFEYFATEHFRLSGVYWGATALAALGRLHLLDADETVAWTLSCRREYAPRLWPVVRAHAPP